MACGGLLPRPTASCALWRDVDGQLEDDGSHDAGFVARVRSQRLADEDSNATFLARIANRLVGGGARAQPHLRSSLLRELRQTKPFGYKRSEGIKRLEDTFILVRKLYDSMEPFSYEGNFWNYKGAFIGGARPAIRPEFWALGGGPVLLDIAAKHADGFEAAVPHAISSPDKFAKTARMLREKVEGYGRDPDKFGMGIWFICISHEDPEVIERVLDSPLVRFFAALSGRMDATEWIAEGMTPPMPEGWHYANSWSPCEQTVDEVNGIVSRVPKEMARKSFYCGTPDQLAKISRQYIDAGADFVGLLDYTPLVLGPADGMASVQRGIKIFRSQK